VRPFVDPTIAAKYVTPQGGPNENYFFTPRDAFRTEGFSRMDFAASYNRGVGVGNRKLDLFIQAQVLNLFNQQDMCGCGGTVFQNGGNIQFNTVSGATPGQSVQTSLNNANLVRFNPLTQTPVEGVNWVKTAAFGTPINRFAYDSPREFRVTFGVRF